MDPALLETVTGWSMRLFVAVAFFTVMYALYFQITVRKLETHPFPLSTMGKLGFTYVNLHLCFSNMNDNDDELNKYIEENWKYLALIYKWTEILFFVIVVEFAMLLFFSAQKPQ